MIRRRTVSAAALALLTLLLALPEGAALAAAHISDGVADALTRPDAAARLDDGRLLVWVHYRDKGLTDSVRDRALQDLADRLPEKVAARRARLRDPGALPVDEGDLPVWADYLAAARALGAQQRHTSRWLNAASFRVTDAQLASLAARPEVARISLVARDRRSAPPALRSVEQPHRTLEKSAAGDWTWDYGGSQAAMEQLNVPAVHALGLTGRDVVVGMLDTGFRTTHEALRHIPVLGAWDFVDGDAVVDEEAGDPAGSRNHGTQTLSNVAARRPGNMMSAGFGVSVLLARTEHLTEEVPAEEDNWVAGLEWAEANGADIISSSLGYIDWYEFADLDGNTAVTTRAADQAAARGLVVVTSAGNDRLTTGMLIAPGDADSVVTVGAVDWDGYVAWFSSPGPTADGRIKPDVTARGVSNLVANPNDDRGYGAASGTSFSCPLVSGVVALMLERAPDLTPVQVMEALRMSAGQAGSPDNDKGWGVVDAYGAVTWFGPVFDHTPLPDTEDTGSPVTVAASITARAGLAAAAPQVLWRANGGPWQGVDLALTGGGPTSWMAQIPAQATGTLVDYYLSGADAAGVNVTEPVRGPGRHHTYRVGPDTTPPTVVHWAVGNQTLFVWPPTVACSAEDNLGVAGVVLDYRLNGGPVQGPFPLADLGGGDWSTAFPLPLEQISEGDTVEYRLTATDAAAAANTGATIWHAIDVVPMDRQDVSVTDATVRSVPDADPAGVWGYTVVDSASAGTIWKVAVDIAVTHPDRGQLRVELISPVGTHVMLHNRSGAGTPDLSGTWEATLTVDGPGALDDYAAEPSLGAWFLYVYDDVAGGTGTLDSWTLHLAYIDEVSSAGDGVPGLRDRLLPNVPNPFNPRTEIRFELARGGRTRLSVFDLRGMLVRNLLDEDLDAGPHRQRWDGRDRRGRDTGSGVYLYRLTTSDGVVHQRKMTLLR